MTDFDQQALADLLDRDAVHRCIIRWTRGMDRHDNDLIASCYHPDATDDHGEFVGLSSDFIPYATMRHDSWKKHQHYILNNTIEVDGDTAHSEAYYFAVFERLDDAVTDFSVGRYLDRFERRNGEWRIAHRLTILDWIGELPGPDEGTASPVLDQFIQGTWDRTDASYARPLVLDREPRMIWEAK
jgi:hypothetical protein